MGFLLVPTLVTLNGVIALILRYFTEFNSFAACSFTVVEERPILSAEYLLSLLAKTDPPCLATLLSYLLTVKGYNFKSQY